MKYRVKHLRFNGTLWTCTLEWWEECECNKQSKKVEIHQVNRPSLLIIKDRASL